MNSALATACPLTPEFLNKFWKHQPRRHLDENSLSVLRFFVEMFFFTDGLTMDAVYEAYLDCIDDRNSACGFAEPGQLCGVKLDDFIERIEAFIRYCADAGGHADEPDDASGGGSVIAPATGSSSSAFPYRRWHTEFGVLPLNFVTC
jgi:hypothetical protein